MILCSTFVYCIALHSCISLKLGTCHISILIPEHANQYLISIYIYIPQIAACSMCFAAEFTAPCDPLKNAHSKSSLQALNNGSTVGGPVAVWMPSQYN